MCLPYHNVSKLQGSYIINIDLYSLTEIETETERVCVFGCSLCINGLREVQCVTTSETTVMCFLNEHKYFYHKHYQHSSVF